MTKKTIQDKAGRWVVPDDQVEEFLYSKIDYDKLIDECLKDASIKEQRFIGAVASVKRESANIRPSVTARYRYR